MKHTSYSKQTNSKLNLNKKTIMKIGNSGRLREGGREDHAAGSTSIIDTVNDTLSTITTQTSTF